MSTTGASSSAVAEVARLRSGTLASSATPMLHVKTHLGPRRLAIEVLDARIALSAGGPMFMAGPHSGPGFADHGELRAPPGGDGHQPREGDRPLFGQPDGGVPPVRPPVMTEAHSNRPTTPDGAKGGFSARGQTDERISSAAVVPESVRLSLDPVGADFTAGTDPKLAESQHPAPTPRPALAHEAEGGLVEIGTPRNVEAELPSAELGSRHANKPRRALLLDDLPEDDFLSSGLRDALDFVEEDVVSGRRPLAHSQNAGHTIEKRNAFVAGPGIDDGEGGVIELVVRDPQITGPLASSTPERLRGYFEGPDIPMDTHVALFQEFGLARAPRAEEDDPEQFPSEPADDQVQRPADTATEPAEQLSLRSAAIAGAALTACLATRLREHGPNLSLARYSGRGPHVRVLLLVRFTRRVAWTMLCAVRPEERKVEVVGSGLHFAVSQDGTIGPLDHVAGRRPELNKTGAQPCERA